MSGSLTLMDERCLPSSPGAGPDVSGFHLALTAAARHDRKATRRASREPEFFSPCSCRIWQSGFSARTQ